MWYKNTIRRLKNLRKKEYQISVIRMNNFSITHHRKRIKFRCSYDAMERKLLLFIIYILYSKIKYFFIRLDSGNNFTNATFFFKNVNININISASNQSLTTGNESNLGATNEATERKLFLFILAILDFKIKYIYIFLYIKLNF